MTLITVKGPTSFGGGSALLRASLGGQLRPAPHLPAHLCAPFASLFLLSWGCKRQGSRQGRGRASVGRQQFASTTLISLEEHCPGIAVQTQVLKNRSQCGIWMEARKRGSFSAEGIFLYLINIHRASTIWGDTGLWPADAAVSETGLVFWCRSQGLNNWKYRNR